MEIQAKDMGNSKERPTRLGMQAIGNLEVIERVWKKKNLLEKSDSQANEIKTALILEGGGQKGVIGAGATVGLEQVNIIDSFDYLVGVSAGACGIAYTAAGQAALGTSVYYEDNVEGGFVNRRRIRQVMKTNLIEKVMREVKPVDVASLRVTRANLIVGAMNGQTGEEEYFYIKKLDDPLSAVVASICVPILSGGESVTINSTPYMDGSFGDPIPVRFAIEKLECTDIVLNLNSPFVKRKKPSQARSLIIEGIARFPYRYSNGVRKAIRQYQKRYNETLDFIQETISNDPNHRILVIAPKEERIDNFTMDAEKLKSAAFEARDFAFNLFSKVVE